MTCDIDTILQQACANKFLCNLSEKDIEVLILQLLCNMSSGATQQVFAGNGPPTTQVPAFSAGIYWDYNSKQQYNWNPVSLAWE